MMVYRVYHGLPTKKSDVPASFGKIRFIPLRPNRPQVLVLPALFGLGVHARHPDDPSGPPRRERLDFDGRNGTGGESEMKTAAQLGVGGHDFFGGIQMFDPIIAMFLRGALCP